jgi:Zn-dependent protease
MNLDPAALREAALYFIILVCSLTLHEWGHAIVADRLGDDTPRREGRVTLDPLAHIDWIGTILVPAMGALGMFGRFGMIGWAKPVYTNPSNFRRRIYDQALVTIAGPGVNLSLALFATIGAAVCAHLQPAFGPLCFMVQEINVALFVFNLLPIPPLDGSKFLIYWFGMSEEAYVRATMWGGFVLLLLVNLPPFRALFGFLINLALVPFDLLYGLLK